MIVRKSRRRAIQWASVVWLALVWTMLWGDLSFGTVIIGAVIGVVVQFVFPLPRLAYHGRIRPGYLAALIGRFLFDLVRASIDVARVAVSPKAHPRGAVLRVEMRSSSDLYLTLTAEMVSLVPGSLIVETQRRAGIMYVHVLDVRDEAGVERARQAVLDQEARLLYAVASADEIEAAGLSVPGRGRKKGVS